MRNKLKTTNRGGTKVEYDGIEFKSKLELYTYKRLKELNIEVEYEGKTFTLVEPFIYNNKKIQAMTYTPDFIGENFIIECKGYSNESFPLRWKIFNYYLYINNIKVDLYKPHTNKQVDKAVSSIVKKLKKKK